MKKKEKSLNELHIQILPAGFVWSHHLLIVVVLPIWWPE